MGAKILFVDDDEGNLFVCEAHCSPEFEVLTALTAQDALTLLAKEEVGVVVSDQRMPGTSGVELLARVRDEYPDTVRILITAYTDLSAAIDAINEGQVRRYLRKPWQPEELIAELRDALDVYEKSRKLRVLGSRLRETERVYALGIIAAGLGHELRNPMSWIAGNLQLMKSQTEAVELLAGQPGGESQLTPHISKLRRSLDDAEEGVNRVLDIVRGIGNPLKSPPESAEPVDLEEVLRLTLRLISGELRETTRLTQDIRSCPMVIGSTTKVGQIVLNLLVNAIQALAERRVDTNENEIRVRLFQEEDLAHLHISDNGAGIPESDRERIFDPFFTTKAGEGTGLGLAICRSITQELGGELQVDQDPDLGGARFRLTLRATSPVEHALVQARARVG